MEGAVVVQLSNGGYNKLIRIITIIKGETVSILYHLTLCIVQSRLDSLIPRLYGGKGLRVQVKAMCLHMSST